MAMVQIDEAELLAHQNVTATVNEMLANPASRKLLLTARKTANPRASIPEIDAAAPVQSELAEIRKELKADQDARAAERAEALRVKQLEQFSAKTERQKASLRAQGWRDEGIASLEAFALENGVPDLEIAASHWEKLHPPAEPVQPNGSGSWGFFDQPTEDDGKFVKAMIDTRGEDEGALNAEIRAALADVRGSSASVRR